MKRFNKIFAVCLTLSVLGGYLLPSPWTCGGFTEPVTVEVQAEGEPTTIDSGIGVLITMLLANGIRFVGNFNDSVKPGIEKLWDDFTTATGNQITLTTLGAQSVISLGYLRTSSAVNNAVNAFQNWYQNTFNVPNTGTVNVNIPGNAPYVSGQNYLLYNDLYVGFFDSSGNPYSDTRAVYYIYAGYLYTWMFSEVSGIRAGYKQGSAPTSSSLSIASTFFKNGKTYFYNRTNIGNIANSTVVVNTVDVSMVQNVDSAWELAYGGSGSIGDISMTGQTLELKDGFNISNDQAKLIDLAGIESLVGTLGLTLENVNDLIDSIPLIMDYPWAESFPDDPTYADTPVDAIPWVDAPTAVIPAEVPEYVPETPADEGSYKVLGLERVFPFSIPFDFIAVVNILNAEPVCPEFTFRVYNPISSQNIDATMSFERFESVAQVIRIVETIGFIVFLILITRSLIRS